METRYLIAITFIMALSLLVGTMFSLSWLVLFSTVLIGIINFSFFIYLIFSGISLYGVTYTPQQAIEYVDIDKQDIIDSLELLDNPLVPRSYNIGILGTFAISLAHIGSTVFTFSIIMMILYILVFMLNKKIITKLYNLTLD